jgi:2,3-bisphosphoglycerate-independent phosphoglycerate mutase
MGIEMSDNDVAFRVNLITLEGSGPYEDLRIKDHSSGDIPSEEARTLLEVIENELSCEDIHFYPGISYRHALIAANGHTEYELTPPHDVLTKRAGDYLPRGKDAKRIEILMRKSYELLKGHPINLDRINKGLNPANSIWIWGQGKKPRLPSLQSVYGVKGVIVAAVDLIKGIGLCAGLSAVTVPGATGTLLTNYNGKADCTINAFREGYDFVYIHVEAPDECAHQGDLEGKIESLIRIDREIVKPVLDYLSASGETYRILIVPDHRTPMELRTHTSEPVPFVLFDSEIKRSEDTEKAFSESSGEKGIYYDSGCALAKRFFSAGK